MNAKTVSPQKARKLTIEKLAEMGIEFDTLRVKTTNFSDLARCSATFVYVAPKQRLTQEQYSKLKADLYRHSLHLMMDGPLYPFG